LRASALVGAMLVNKRRGMTLPQTWNRGRSQSHQILRFGLRAYKIPRFNASAVTMETRAFFT